jgi:REP element-mobilizing transposase RayT
LQRERDESATIRPQPWRDVDSDAYGGDVARKLRERYDNALYHGMSRGVDGLDIFRSVEDYAHFLLLLLVAQQKFGLRIYGYCLMPNHFHLLVRTPSANISEAMQWLLGCYAASFNRKYGRRGHLFGGRFHAELITSRRHLLEVTRYIVLNAVRARICSAPARYRWSSYRALVGLEPEPAFLDAAFTLSLFDPRDPTVARTRFRAFVADRAPP